MKVLVVGASRAIGLEFVRQDRADDDEATATPRDEAGLERLSGLGAAAPRLDVADAASRRVIADLAPGAERGTFRNFDGATNPW